MAERKLTLLEWLDVVEYALNCVPNTRLLAAPNNVKNTYELAAQAKAMIATVADAQNMLVENLTAWDGEEDSVKEEHHDLIARLRSWTMKEGV